MDIAFAMAGDVHRNARALRQLSALSDAGLTVEVVSLPGSDILSALPATVRHRPLEIPGQRGARFFLALHRGFLRELQQIDARLYHASDLYVLPAVRRAAEARSAPYTYDARELYAHVSATVGRPHVRLLWRQVERRHIRGASQVWTVSDSIADHLPKSHGIPRPHVQLNAPALAAAPPGTWLRDSLSVSTETPLLLHLGQLRKDRGAEELVHAMAAWREQDPADARLVFLGYGPDRGRLEGLVADRGLEHRVHFLDAVPPSQLPSITAEADLGVTLLQPTCLNHQFALPNKLFSYLAAGVPVVASDLLECRRIVQDYDCGWTVDPSNVSEIRDALAHGLRNAAAKRRNALTAGETLDWKKTSESFSNRMFEIIERA